MIKPLLETAHLNGVLEKEIIFTHNFKSEKGFRYEAVHFLMCFGYDYLMVFMFLSVLSCVTKTRRFF